MPDLAAVDARLRTLFDPYRARLDVTQDGPGGLMLYRQGDTNPWGYFGGVRRGRRYVSYYLMPVYAHEPLHDSISPELRRRMQGKSCFNFTSIDEGLIGELQSLTQASFDAFESPAYPRQPGSSRAG